MPIVGEKCDYTLQVTSWHNKSLASVPSAILAGELLLVAFFDIILLAVPANG